MCNIYVAPGAPVTIVNGDTTIYLNNNKKGKDNRMNRFNKKKEMGTCPKCGSDYNEMTDYEMDVDCLWTKWYCKDCEETWTEYYTLTYDGYCHDGNVYDADGKECTDI